MFKVDQWFKKIADECGCKIIDVERAYRTTRNELMKKGLEPDDPKYNSELMKRTKQKVMNETKERSFTKYSNFKEFFENNTNDSILQKLADADINAKIEHNTVFVDKDDVNNTKKILKQIGCTYKINGTLNK